MSTFKKILSTILVLSLLAMISVIPVMANGPTEITLEFRNLRELGGGEAAVDFYAFAGTAASPLTFGGSGQFDIDFTFNREYITPLRIENLSVGVQGAMRWDLTQSKF